MRLILLVLFSTLTLASHAQKTLYYHSLEPDFLMRESSNAKYDLNIKKVTQYSVLETIEDTLQAEKITYQWSCNYELEFDSLLRKKTFSYNFSPMLTFVPDSLYLDSLEMNKTVKYYFYDSTGKRTVQIKPYQDLLDPIDLDDMSTEIWEERMLNGHANNVLIHSSTHENGVRTRYNYEYVNKKWYYLNELMFSKVVKRQAELNKKLTIYFVYEYFD